MAETHGSWEHGARREHTRKGLFKRLVGGLVAAIMWAAPAAAQDEAGAEAVVAQVNDALLEVMQAGPELGYQGRYERLEPVLEEAFNFPFMARVAVGPAWKDLAPAEQERLAELFGQMSVANFAARFDDYSGQEFEIAGQRPGPRGAVLVENNLVQPEGEPVGINYLVQQFDGEWQIIDVLLDSKFSELARQRSEFGSVLRSGGYESLIATIERKIEELAGQG